MLKVLTFMKQVADGLQLRRETSGLPTSIEARLNAVIALYWESRYLHLSIGVSPEWLKGTLRVYLRSRGCSWNTVSTYLRT